MLYPLAWVPPDLPITPAPPAPDLPAVGINQRQPSAQARLVNRPKLALKSVQVAFSGQPRPLAQGLGELRSPTAPTVLAEQENRAKNSVLRLGSQGEAVKLVQTRLQQWAYYRGEVDGLFGPLTDQAVRDFQQAVQSPVDGVVGPATWAQLLGGASVATHLPQPSRPPYLDGAVHGAANGAPIFSASTVSTHLSFHPIGVTAETPHPRLVWVVVLALGTAGLVTSMGFRRDLPPQSPPHLAHGFQPLPSPHPVYPAKIQRSSPPPPGSTPPLAVTPPRSLAPSPGDPPLLPTVSTAPTDYLPSFVYDILQPYGRYELETVLQGKPPVPNPDHSTESPLLAALLQRVGAFPNRNYGTGTPYTYILLDDLGGCFRICDNELWITHLARRWFQADLPYRAIIRRIDGDGKVMDKEFTVALSQHQLAWAA